MSEVPGNGFPPEEYAPLWLPDEGEPRGDVHISQLTPDPEAEMSLKAWAELGYQFKRLQPPEELFVTIKGPSSWMEVEYPMYDDWGDLPTSILARIIPFGEAGEEAGRTRKSAYLHYDMARPGFVQIENITLTTDLEDDDNPWEIYITKDSKMVRHVTENEILDDHLGRRLTEELKQSHSLNEDEEDSYEDWLKACLKQMGPALKEAFTKRIIKGEPLDFDPERDFRQEWGSLFYRRENFIFFNINAVGTDVYYPPHMCPDPIGGDTREFMETKTDSPFLWTKASWGEAIDFSSMMRLVIVDSPRSLEQIDIRQLMGQLPSAQLKGLLGCVDIQLNDYVASFNDHGKYALDRWGEEYEAYRQFAMEHFPQAVQKRPDLYMPLADLRQQIEN